MADTLAALLTAPTLPFAASVTAVLLVVFPPFEQYVPNGSVADLLARVHRLLLVIAIVSEGARLHPALWLAVTAVHVAWLVRAYAVADNHRYLEAYWCAAMAAALFVGAETGGAILTRNALLLVALPFALSVLWKLLSPSYRNGSFFLSMLLFDPRFGAFGHVIGGVGPGQLATYWKKTRAVRNGGSDVEYLDIPPAYRRLSQGLTWWTIAIEGAIAVAFLIPVAHLQSWQLAPLLAFAITTYVFVPIATFSNVLLVMLAVSTPDAQWRGIILATLGSLTIVMFVGNRLSAWYHSRGWKAVSRLSAESADLVGVP